MLMLKMLELMPEWKRFYASLRRLALIFGRTKTGVEQLFGSRIVLPRLVILSTSANPH